MLDATVGTLLALGDSLGVSDGTTVGAMLALGVSLGVDDGWDEIDG